MTNGAYDKYITDLFSWNIYYSWIDCIWHTAIQQIHQIQRNEMARNDYQFWNLIGSYITSSLRTCNVSYA